MKLIVKYKFPQTQFFFISLFILLILPKLAKADDSKKIYTGMFGLWAWSDWDSALKIVKENSFDIAVGVSRKDVLDKAHALGLKCIVDFGLRKEMLRNEAKWQGYLKGLKEKIIELKDHPAVFAWYVVDEPDYQQIPLEKIKIIRDLVKSIDKTKPIFTVLTIPEKWDQYLPYFDMISIDPYLKKKPDGTSETPEKVRVWIRKMRIDLEDLGMNKPIYVVLGAFKLKSRIPFFFSSPFKKPTPEEFNEMIKIAISERVDGILVWTLSFRKVPKYRNWSLPKDDPKLWESVRSITNVVRDTKQ